MYFRSCPWAVHRGCNRRRMERWRRAPSWASALGYARAHGVSGAGLELPGGWAGPMARGRRWRASARSPQLPDSEGRSGGRPSIRPQRGVHRTVRVFRADGWRTPSPAACRCEGPLVIVDIVGKGRCVRTATVAGWAKDARRRLPVWVQGWRFSDLCQPRFRGRRPSPVRKSGRELRRVRNVCRSFHRVRGWWRGSP
jgi:hypothetical protein